jgi:uncharacterized protein (TIGR01244 family)
MADIRPVTLAFAVAPQLTAADMSEVAAAGYKTVIANRPDGESPDQVTLAEARAAAEAAGLAFISIPFTGAPTAKLVRETKVALDGAQAPVLAYCRSGTRSITIWALAQAIGSADTDDIIAKAASAGYDLSDLKTMLKHLP